MARTVEWQAGACGTMIYMHRCDGVPNDGIANTGMDRTVANWCARDKIIHQQRAQSIKHTGKVSGHSLAPHTGVRLSLEHNANYNSLHTAPLDGDAVRCVISAWTVGANTLRTALACNTNTNNGRVSVCAHTYRPVMASVRGHQCTTISSNTVHGNQRRAITERGWQHYK